MIKKYETMQKPNITVETHVAADIKKVWDFWTGPEHVTHWNFATDDWHCPSATNDLRKGGQFNYTMASKDGKMSFNFEGIYDEVINQKQITYSLADGRQVIVLFEKLDNLTKVMEHFDPENENSEELQREGWQGILNNFKKYVETK